MSELQEAKTRYEELLKEHNDREDYALFLRILAKVQQVRSAPGSPPRSIKVCSDSVH